MILPKINLYNKNENTSKNQNENSTKEVTAKELEFKLSQIAKLYEVEKFKNKYANKETLKILCPLKSSEKYKKEIFQANTLKINNMLNPFNHSEYTADCKIHNLVKDEFKKHAEEVLRFKHLERNESRKVK